MLFEEKSAGSVVKMNMILKISEPVVEEADQGYKRTKLMGTAKGIVTAKPKGKKLQLYNEQTQSTIVTYDCFDQIIDTQQGILDLFGTKEGPILTDLMAGKDAALIVLGPHNLNKSQELFCGSASPFYNSKNVINSMISTLLTNIKNPILCISIAEIVATSGEGGKVTYELIDLLNEKMSGKSEVKNKLIKIQILLPEYFDYLIEYASAKSSGFLTDKGEHKIQIQENKRFSFIVKLYCANNRTSFVLADMCGFRRRFFEEVASKKKNKEISNPAQLALRKLLEYLEKNVNEEGIGEDILSIYEELFSNRKMHLMLNVSSNVHLNQLQPILNLIENLSVNEFYFKPSIKRFEAKSIKYLIYESKKSIKLSKINEREKILLYK